MASVRSFIRRLTDSPDGNIFNPWRDVDPDHDASDRAPALRRENLEAYLSARIGKARWLLVAEAVGFRGGKFSGIAMTCERQLPAPNPRTSRVDIPLSGADQKLGVLEPTAMIVARTLAKSNVDPRAVVLWNTFAWHPHKPGSRLTNRLPTPRELQHGIPVLKEMLNLFAGVRLIAIGKTCQRIVCQTLQIEAPCVRHPANGGATEFARGVAAVVRGT